MKSIKTIVTIVLMLFSVSLFAQHQHQSAKDLLKDKATQDSVMTAIAGDHQMMMNMMQHMKQNKQAMYMMQDKGMMKQMMDMAGKDSSMCRSMMSMMMENKNMHQMMMDMMMNKNNSGGMMNDKMNMDSTKTGDHKNHH